MIILEAHSFLTAAATPSPATDLESTVDTVTESATEAVDAVTHWWQHPVTQQWLIDIPVQISVILLVATIAHWALRRLVRILAKRSIDNGGRKLGISTIIGRGHNKEEVTRQVQMMREAQENRRQSRVRTLAGVLNSAIAIVVWISAVLMILSAIGVNIAPLIASAGVVGVALGFGAQSLVKDFLSGIFMLIEDQYGIGDTIDVNDGISGTVEDISLRTTTLRDIDGTLWYIRNGEILRVGNLSDGYAIARIEIPIGLKNDTAETTEAITAIANAAAKDEAVDNVILEEPDLNGITAIHPDHVVYRLSIKTLPGDQWAVQRHIQAALIDGLRERNIDLPYPDGLSAETALSTRKEEQA